MTISSPPRSRVWRAPFRAAALGLGVLVVLASACGDSEPAATPAPSPSPTPVAKTPAPAPTPPQAGTDVEMGDSGTPPKGIPEDLPVYPGARSKRWLYAKGPGAIIEFETDSDPASVYEFFTTELPGAGWEVETQSAAPTHWMVVAAKGGRKARISIVSGSAGGTQFGVAVSEAN